MGNRSRVTGSQSSYRRPGSCAPRVSPVPTTCAFCGVTAPEDLIPLTWTTASENGRDRAFCDKCSREHLRAMESKLDSEWW